MGWSSNTGPDRVRKSGPSRLPSSGRHAEHARTDARLVLSRPGSLGGREIQQPFSAGTIRRQGALVFSSQSSDAVARYTTVWRFAGCLCTSIYLTGTYNQKCCHLSQSCDLVTGFLGSGGNREADCVSFFFTSSLSARASQTGEQSV